MPKSMEDIIREVMNDPELARYMGETNQNFRPMMDRSGPMANKATPMTSPDLEASSIPTQYDLMYNPNTLEKVPPPRLPIDRIAPGQQYDDSKTWQQGNRDEEGLLDSLDTSKMRTLNPEFPNAMPMQSPQDYMQSKPEFYDMDQLMKYYTQGGGENI
jgi:hypothetical protein